MHLKLNSKICIILLITGRHISLVCAKHLNRSIKTVLKKKSQSVFGSLEIHVCANVPTIFFFALTSNKINYNSDEASLFYVSVSDSYVSDVEAYVLFYRLVTR